MTPWRTIARHLAALLVASGAAASPAAALDASQRFACQEAIEEVAWRHRTRPDEGSFARDVPEAVIRRRAEDVLLETSALESFWQIRLGPEQLQAELDRMASRSRSPERLRELLAALGDDPERAAECLARPLLTDRMVRSSYAHDERLHAEVEERARREARELAAGGWQTGISGLRTEVEWRRGREQGVAARELDLPPEEYDARLRELQRTLGSSRGAGLAGLSSPLREDDNRFYLVVVHEADATRVRFTSFEWPKRSFDGWWAEARASLAPAVIDRSSIAFRLPRVSGAACVDDSWTPTQQLLDPRYWHTAVWTGSEMIVFGGMSSVGTIYGDGSRYDPATDTWQLLPTLGSPGARQSHVAVWTGTEMVVWGGRADASGGRYNPSTDSWSPTALANAPQPRVNASVVWTGSEMLVWGGEGSTGLLNSGGRYDPASNSWTSMATAPLTPRAYHSAVWTGTEMIIWNGYNVHLGQLYGDGARYNPATNAWTPVSTTNAPDARCYHTAVWTGTEMIIWGGANEPAYDQSGGRYNPVTDSWTPTSLVDPPSHRSFHAAVWTGSEMIVQGGSFNVVAGGRYDPVTDTWTATNPVNSANNGQGITAVWTGTEMIVWGGLDDDGVFHYDGGRYDPATDLWTATGTMNVPAARGLHAAAWTGSEMVIWGGNGWGGTLPPGASYDPATDSWRAVSTVDAPISAEKAVWTGTEVIFWGSVQDGGRYNPATDSWSFINPTNAPMVSIGYSLVWTGNEMIVFGGIGMDNVAKRYRPSTDSWTDATTVNAPGARDHHAAVWTGTEMIIWGGFINDGITPTGGRYNPVTNHWTPTNVADSPVTRMWPVAVWTGSEMLVWGGHDWLAIEDLGDGARYRPSDDSWSVIQPNGAPTPRVAQGVWTGSELLLWGGTIDSSGGRYAPATDAWRPTTLVEAPPVRIGGRWSTVWTGSEMIIWGGINETQQGGRYCAAQAPSIFLDGFESGDTSAWSSQVP